MGPYPSHASRPMKIDDFQPPDPKLSFLSVFGGLMSSVLIIVGLELWSGQLTQTARTEPTQTEPQLVWKPAQSNLSKP